jgi:hypothetical protein
VHPTLEYLASALISATAHAAPLDIPSPWVEGAAKSYVLTIEQTTEGMAMPVQTRKVTTPLVMRVLSRGDDDVVVSWEFDPATVAQQGCPIGESDTSEMLASGWVRPRLELRVDDSDNTVRVVNLVEANEATLALLAKARTSSEAACGLVDDAQWRKSMQYDHRGKNLSGREAKVFMAHTGVLLDPDEPTAYDEVIDFSLFDPEIPSRSTWRVVERDRARHRVSVEWTNRMDAETGPAALEEATQALVAHGVLSELVAALPGSVAANEQARLIVDEKTGWIRELDYELFVKIGTTSSKRRIRFREG